jgi:YVTN family beta-propeller protein
VSILDAAAHTVVKTLTVGSGARGIAVDAAGHAYVTNQNDGTVSVIDLTAATVLTTLHLGASTRPAAIQLIGATGFGIVADPAAGGGDVLVFDVVTGVTTKFSVRPAQNGGSDDVLVVGTTVYVASQSGGTIGILPLTIAGTTVTGTASTLKLGPGIRSLAYDSKDKLLLAVNESGGQIVLVNVPANTIAGSIKAVVAEDGEGDDNHNDHSDHDHAGNMPKNVVLSPASAHLNSTFTLTATGTGLTGATAVNFVLPSSKHDDDGKPAPDSGITVSGISVNAAGTSLTATVKVAANAALGARMVTITTPNGSVAATTAFTVQP